MVAEDSSYATPSSFSKEELLSYCAEKWFIETKNGRYRPDYAIITKILIRLFNPISFNGNLFVYDNENGVYLPENDALGTFIVAVVELSEFKGTISSLLREIYTRIRMIDCCKKSEYPFDNDYVIGFNNGVLVFTDDGQNCHLEPFSPKFKITHKFSVDWNPDANPDLFANEVGRVWVTDEVVPELYKPLAAAILQGLPMNQAVKRIWITLGGSNSGKSTYANLIEMCVGRSFVGRLTLQQLCDSGNRFDRYTLLGKTVNIGEDISAKKLNDVTILKAITGSLYHDVEAKGENKMSAKLTCSYLFSANSLPELSKDAMVDDAFFERIELIEFPRLFANDPTWVSKHIRPEILESFMLNVIRMVQKYWFGIPKSRTIDETRDLWLNYNRNAMYYFLLDTTEPCVDGFIVKDEFRTQLRLWSLDCDYKMDDEVIIQLKRSVPTDDEIISKEVFRNSVGVKTRKVTVNGVRRPCYCGIRWKSDFKLRVKPDTQTKLTERIEAENASIQA